VSFTPLPGDFRRNWTLAVVAAEEEFVAPIRRTSIIILIAGTGFLVVAGLGVVGASRLLTRPIWELIAETKRIRQLDMDKPVAVDTKVTELAELSGVLGSMKAALSSFSVYVPKEVVRAIVTSGAESVVGGVRQPVSVLFTDLVGFTASSEGLDPEEVLHRLSEYFDTMS
jgi:adenylate cyclase